MNLTIQFAAIVALAEIAADSFIEKGRRVSMTLSKSLPAYVVMQTVRREVQASGSGGWQSMDRISAEVVFNGGSENIRSAVLNGKAVSDKEILETGAWSTGQFGGLLHDLFHASSSARFSERGKAKISGRETRVFDFSVEGGKSNWVLSSGGRTHTAAYQGTIWLDIERASPLRFVIRAHRLPADFPLEKAESVTEYGLVQIGPGQYLLPKRSLMLGCNRAGANPRCARNMIEFRDYRRFEVDSIIEFDRSR